MANKIVFIAFVFFCLSCAKTKNTASEEIKIEEEISFLALGDSYTIGESVPENERWPVQLAEALNERGIAVSSPLIIAETGWTTDDLLAAMEARLSNNKKYDLVSVLIGVNNQYQNKSIADYEADLHLIFQKAIIRSSNGKKGVFVVSIPDYGVTPFGAQNAEEIAREIEAFNEVLKNVASEYGLTFYNITPISKLAKEQPELIAEDGLHPSGKMYEMWVEEFIDEIAEKLAEINS